MTPIKSIQVEIMKLQKRRKSWWLLGLTLGLSALIVVVLFAIEQVTGSHAVQTNQTMGWILRQMMWFVLPLFTAMIAIDVFSQERSKGSIKNTLLLPVERYKVYVSKALVLALAVWTLLLGIYLVTLILGILFFGLTGLGISVLGLFLDYVAAGLPLILLGLLVGVLSQVLSSGGSIMAISVIAYMVLNLVGAFYSNVYLYLPTSYMQWYRYQAFSTTWTAMLMFMLAYIIMCVTVGVWQFDRKEL